MELPQSDLHHKLGKENRRYPLPAPLGLGVALPDYPDREGKPPEVDPAPLALSPQEPSPFLVTSRPAARLANPVRSHLHPEASTHPGREEAVQIGLGVLKRVLAPLLRKGSSEHDPTFRTPLTPAGNTLLC